LYVHGATYPASTAFDLKLDGLSWMDYIATRGYDVYLLDLRGYGKSTRPPEMAQEAKLSPPIVRGDTAVKDISPAVDFLPAQRADTHAAAPGWAGTGARCGSRPTRGRPPARSSAGGCTRPAGSARPPRWCRPGPGRLAPIAR